MPDVARVDSALKLHVDLAALDVGEVHHRCRANPSRMVLREWLTVEVDQVTGLQVEALARSTGFALESSVDAILGCSFNHHLNRNGPWSVDVGGHSLAIVVLLAGFGSSRSVGVA